MKEAPLWWLCHLLMRNPFQHGIYLTSYPERVLEVEETLAREMWDAVQKHNNIYLDEERSPPFSSMDLESPTPVVKANPVHDEVLS